MAWTWGVRTPPDPPSGSVTERSVKLLYVNLTYALYCMAFRCQIYVVLLKMCWDFHSFYNHLCYYYAITSLLGYFVAGFLL